jgi:DNA-binding GntR family transcriptional regulator
VEGLSRLMDLNGATVREATYQTLRNAILSGAIGPGERLVERDLAELLAVSRTPVREALQKLEQERLVQKVPRRGMVVSGFTPRDLEEFYLIRTALEGLATGLAAERCTPERLRLLEELLAEMQDCIAGNEIFRYRNLHTRFNELIYQAAESPRLKVMLLQLRALVSQVAEYGYRLPGRLEAAQTEHEAIVAAIRSRNREAAEAAARYHVTRSREAVQAAMSLRRGNESSSPQPEQKEEGA